MSIHQIGGVFIRVRNLENSIDFYSNLLGLRLRGIEQWENGRGATFFTDTENGRLPLLTLVESDHVQVLSYPFFNLVTKKAADMHQVIQKEGHNVSELKKWSSEWNDHLMFDVYDPDGHTLNIIEITPIPVRTN